MTTVCKEVVVGSIALYWTKYVCVSVTKNHFHCYQSVIYNLLITQRQRHKNSMQTGKIKECARQSLLFP